MIAFWKHSAKRCESRGRRTLPAVSLVVYCLLLLSCASMQKIERRQGDHVELGRRVPTRAYAWYARARYLHRLGELELARDAYRAVLAEDPGSGAAFAGLGATYCASDREQAEETFARGLRRAVESLPVYLARGRCELGWGKPVRAVDTSRLAFARDPASSEASALLVDALTASGQTAEAARVERAQRLYARSGDLPSSTLATSTGQVDLALAREDYALAEALSLELMSKGTLSVRAFALGRWRFAEEQAALISAASPADQEAWAVLALTRGAALEPRASGDGPGDLVSCLWAEHVRAQAGTTSAELFLNALAQGDARSTMRRWQLAADPLLSACAERLARDHSWSGASPAATSARP